MIFTIIKSHFHYSNKSTRAVINRSQNFKYINVKPLTFLFSLKKKKKFCLARTNQHLTTLSVTPLDGTESNNKVQRNGEMEFY